WSWMPRLWATAAMPAVRQLARPESTISTGVGALSSEAKTCGWSASTVNMLLRDCSAPSPKKLPMAERLCVPLSHSQLARHLNWAASGAFSSASRAPRSAVTLTPLSTLAMVEMLVVKASSLERLCIPVDIAFSLIVRVFGQALDAPARVWIHHDGHRRGWALLVAHAQTCSTRGRKTLRVA